MALKSDNQGFLIGDPVDIGKAVDQLRRIQKDVSDIKRSMLGAPNSGGNGSENAAIDRSAKVVTHVHQRNRTNGLETKAATPAMAPATPAMAPATPAIAPATPAMAPATPATAPATPAMAPATPAMAPATPAIAHTVAATPKGRDASGRFVGQNKKANDAGRDEKPGRFTSNGGGDDEERRSKGILNNFVDRIATTAIGATAGAEQSDPTIKAFQEVAEPMQRGYQSLFGGDEKDNKERWYKKIFKELNLFRKDETAFNKAQNKILKNIEEKSGGHSVSSSGGGLSKMIGMIPGAGLLGGLGKGLLKGGKGLFRKIPFLGALLSGAGAASDIYNTEGDDSLTRLEKDRRNGKTAGGLAGSVGGMMAGAALGSVLGPVGTVVGGAVGMFLGDQGGQIIGEKLGEWTTELRDADIPGKIIGAWNATTDAIKSGWDGALKLMSSAWDKTKEAADAANDFVKEKTGVDVKQTVQDTHKNLVDYTSEKVIPPLVELKNKGMAAVNRGAEWIGENTTVGKGAKALSGKLQDRWNDAKQYLGDAAQKAGIDPGILAKITHFESGFNSEAMPKRKDGSLISSAHGYGQFLDGTWKDMLNKHGSKYGVKNAGTLSEAEAEGLRSDKTLQANMLAEFTKENIEKGRKLGGSNDDANVYALHNLGSVGGQAFLKALKANPNAPVSSIKGMTQSIISGNKSLYGDGAGTIQDAYDKMGAAMARGEMFAQDIKANQTPKPESAPAVASIAEDPTQGGRYKFETLEGGKVQVTDNQTGVMELASDEQANAYRKQQGKPYLDKVAAINAGNIPLYQSLAAGPGSSQTQTAFAAAPKVPTFTPAPVPAEAPPQITPLASLDSGRNVTVTMPTPDVRRDVSDRGVAHIVTGGLSGRG
jgi:hypothetical protein